MKPFGTRGRADALALQLDAPSGAALPGSPVPAPPVALARSLRGVGTALAPATAPRPEFRAALRTRLVAVASVQAATAATAAPRPPAAPVPAWLTGRRVRQGAGAAAGALASVVAVSGVAVASSSSLPGDPFYGVKRTTEALQVRAADGDMAEGGRHLELAATRLREVRGLTLGRSAMTTDAVDATTADLDAPTAQRVRRTLADMDAETREGSRLMTEAYRSSQTAAPLLALARFSSKQAARLEGLMPVLPAAAQDRARASLALLTGVSMEAGQLLDPALCAPACDPMTVPAPLTSPGADVTPAPSPAPSAAPSGGAPAGTSEVPARPQSEPSDQPAPASPRPASSPRPAPSSDAGVPVPQSSPLPLPQASRSSVPLPGVPGADVPGADVPDAGVPDVDGSIDELLPAADRSPAALIAQVPAPSLR